LKADSDSLNRDLECGIEDITRAITLITAIFTLRNFLIDEQDETPMEAVFRYIVNDVENREKEKETIILKQVIYFGGHDVNISIVDTSNSCTSSANKASQTNVHPFQTQFFAFCIPFLPLL
jgi:hypothetical protein